MNKTPKKVVLSTEVVPQEQCLVLQEKQDEEKSKEMATKIPENNSEHLICTVEKINELTQKHIISKAVEPRNYCVFCRSNNQDLEFKALLEKDKQEKHCGYAVL